MASVVCTEVYSCTAEIWSGSKRCVLGLDTLVLLCSWKVRGKGQWGNWTGGYHKVASIAPGPAALFLADVFRGWSRFWRLCLNKLPTVAQYHDSLAWRCNVKRVRLIKILGYKQNHITYPLIICFTVAFRRRINADMRAAVILTQDSSIEAFNLKVVEKEDTEKVIKNRISN